MLSNNGERLKIVIEMQDPFDYSEFKNLCEKSGIAPLDIGPYSQKIGMLMVAKREYPLLDDITAYLEFVSDLNRGYAEKQMISTTTPTTNPPAKQQSGCGGCGGGKVR